MTRLFETEMSCKAHDESSGKIVLKNNLKIAVDREVPMTYLVRRFNEESNASNAAPNPLKPFLIFEN